MMRTLSVVPDLLERPALGVDVNEMLPALVHALLLELWSAESQESHLQSFHSDQPKQVLLVMDALCCFCQFPGGEC